MKSVIITFLATALITFQSCRTEEGNEKLGEASEKVGESTATIVKKVKSGIEKVSKINIDISENLKNKGISTGKVELGSKQGRHNMLSIYMIFEKKVNRNITLKVTDSQGLEIGRTKTLVNAAAGDAKYFDFVFDKRTNIDRDNKIIME
jgi:hypothetical protein